MESKISKAAFLSILRTLDEKVVFNGPFKATLDTRDVFAVLQNHCEEQLSDMDLDFYLN